MLQACLFPKTLDKYDVRESNSDQPSLKLVDGFSYVLTGRLSGGVLDVGIGVDFFDEILLRDYGYLDGKMVSIKVNRIDAEFLIPE